MNRWSNARGTCANCGIEVTEERTVVDGITYCCRGCASGGPCYCSYDRPGGSVLNCSIGDVFAHRRPHEPIRRGDGAPDEGGGR